MNLLYKLLLTLNATSWMFVIYVVKAQWHPIDVPAWLVGVAILLITVVLSIFSICMAKRLGNDSLFGCSECILADSDFLPTYLGYFFISLSVSDRVTMLFVYGMIFIFVFITQSNYFNPIYLLFGYHYYKVTTNEGTRVFLIVKGKVIRNSNQVEFEQLKRINDSAYLAIKEEQ